MSYPVKQRLDLFGFQISIENPKGSKRTWHDPHSGESGTTYMHHAYGYIRRTEGTDGDHVDVYVGPNHASTRVFIVNQMKKPDFKEFDEQKVMLGWDRPEDAKDAYLKQYNNPKFFGSMKEMALEEFQRKVLDKSFHGKKIANGDMIEYFRDHPQKLKEYLMRKSKGKEAQLAHAHDGGGNLNEASIRRGMKVEMEHTKDPATARQIAIDHLRERPDYYEKLEAVEKRAAIDYFVELNLGKLAAGESEVPASAVLGDKKKDQGIGDNIPPQTDFARAVEGDPIKAASEDRASRIADRVDDVGLGLLGAPSAAYLTGSVLKRLPNAKAKALGQGLQHGVENLQHGTHHGIEAAGLALVSPTVSHAIAKKIDRMLPGEKKVATILVKEDMEMLGRQILRKALEKVASKYIPDFEYHTEKEKLAILEHFARLTKKADALTPIANVARRAGHAEAQVARRAVAARAPTAAVSPAATQFGGAARGYGPVGAQNFYPGGPVGHVQQPAVLNQAAARPPASAVQAAPQKAPRGYGAPAAQNFYPAGGAGHIERPASLNPPVAAPASAPVAATTVPAATTRRRLGWGAVPLGAGIAVGGVGVGAGMAAQGVASGLGTLAQQGGHEPIYGESFVGPGRLGT